MADELKEHIAKVSIVDVLLKQGVTADLIT
jgi:hypothetical protein